MCSDFQGSDAFFPRRSTLLISPSSKSTNRCSGAVIQHQRVFTFRGARGNSDHRPILSR
jgi:hypothetical protein